MLARARMQVESSVRGYHSGERGFGVYEAVMNFRVEDGLCDQAGLVQGCEQRKRQVRLLMCASYRLVTVTICTPDPWL